MSSLRKDFIFQPFKINEVKSRSTEIPRPRSGHRIVCDETNIYLFGGYNPTLPRASVEIDNPTWSSERPLFKELWSFSIATRKWKVLNYMQNIPEELASNAMCMAGKYIMIFGGTGHPFGAKCNNDVMIWRTGSNDKGFKILETTGSKPPGQYGQSILCLNNSFYTIGGTNGFAYNCDIYRLDLQTKVWEPVYVGTGQEGEPIGRYRHEVAQADDKFYIIGGGTGDWAFELMEIPVFDLKTNKWTIMIPKADESDDVTVVPLPRKCHSAVQIDGPNGVQVFVVGGSDGQSVFEDIWRLNISDLQWTLMRKSTLPHPLYFHSSAVTPSGCMYIFGGIEPKNYATCRNNVLYKVWLCVPKLSEICWEAMLHYHPNLDKANGRTLFNLGVPSHFVDRLNCNTLLQEISSVN